MAGFGPKPMPALGASDADAGAPVAPPMRPMQKRVAKKRVTVRKMPSRG